MEIGKNIIRTGIAADMAVGVYDTLNYSGHFMKAYLADLEDLGEAIPWYVRLGAFALVGIGAVIANDREESFDYSLPTRHVVELPSLTTIVRESETGAAVLYVPFAAYVLSGVLTEMFSSLF